MPIDLGQVPHRARISALSFVADAMRLGHPGTLQEPKLWVAAIAAFLADGELGDLEIKMLMLRSYTVGNDTPESALARAGSMVRYIADGDPAALLIGGQPLLAMNRAPMGVPGENEED